MEVILSSIFETQTFFSKICRGRTKHKSAEKPGPGISYNSTVAQQCGRTVDGIIQPALVSRFTS